MKVYALVKKDDYETATVTVCPLYGIEVIDSTTSPATRTVTWSNMTFLLIPVEVNQTKIGTMSALLNNYDNYAYSKEGLTLVKITGRSNVNRKINPADYDGRFPFVCTNMMINVGGIGNGVAGHPSFTPDNPSGGGSGDTPDNPPDNPDNPPDDPNQGGSGSGSGSGQSQGGVVLGDDGVMSDDDFYYLD